MPTLLALTTFLTCILATPLLAGPQGFAHRIELTFDNSMQSADLIDFPVAVFLTDGVTGGVTPIDFSQIRTDGQDIRFYADDNQTLLDYEVEGDWDSSPGATNLIWVRVPSIQAATRNSTIYLYYGNFTAADAQSSTGVWGSNYSAVYHLNQSAPNVLPKGENTASTGIFDSVGGLNSNMTPHYFDDDTVSQTGTQSILGLGAAFDGIDDRLVAWQSLTSSSLVLDGLTSLTVEAWIYYTGDGTQNEAVICGKANSYLLGLRSGRLAFSLETDAPGSMDWRLVGGQLGLIPQNTWTHVACTYDDSQSQFSKLRFFINGERILAQAPANGQQGQIANTGGDPLFFAIGAKATQTIAPYNATSHFPGLIDEVRVSQFAHSDDWLRASYLASVNQFVNAGFAHRYVVNLNNAALPEDLVDFPVLISLTDGVTGGELPIDFSDIQSDGRDIRLYDNDGLTLLDYEIDGQWDSNAGATNHIWVRVPRVSNQLLSDSILLYYGSSTASDAQNPTGVWQNGYVATYHLNEDVPNSATLGPNNIGGVGDSRRDPDTSLTPHFFDGDGDVSRTGADGKIGQSTSYDGLDDVLVAWEARSGTDLTITDSALTLEAWVYYTGDDSVATAYICGKARSYMMAIQNGRLSFSVETEDSGGMAWHALDEAVVPIDEWAHVACVYDGDAADIGDTWRYYVNGQCMGSSPAAGDENGSISNTGNVPSYFSVGAVSNKFTPPFNANSFDDTFPGSIDEVRVSSEARSDEWIYASYLSGMGQFFDVEFYVDHTTRIVNSSIFQESNVLDSVEAAVDPTLVFDFGVQDDGASDGFPTVIDSITLDVFSGADPSEHEWLLSGQNFWGARGSVYKLDVANTYQVVFDNLSTVTPDDRTATYRVYIKLASHPLRTRDGDRLHISLAPSGLAISSIRSSRPRATGAPIYNGTGIDYVVLATELKLSGSLSGPVTTDAPATCKIEYVDANGNRDIDVDSDSVSARLFGSSNLLLGTADAVDGLAIFQGRNALNTSLLADPTIFIEFLDDQDGDFDLATRQLLVGPIQVFLPPSVQSLDPAAGPVTGGYSVAIQGNNLGRVGYVRFDDKQSEIHFTSENEIRVTVPRHNRAESVTVTLFDGANNIVLEDFFVYGSDPSALPRVTHLLPARGSVTGGNGVTILGKNLGAVDVVYFGEQEASLQVVSDTMLTLIVPPAILGSTSTTSVKFGTSALEPMGVATYQYDGQLPGYTSGATNEIALPGCSLRMFPTIQFWIFLVCALCATRCYMCKRKP